MLIAASILKYLSYRLIVLFFWIRFVHRHGTREDAAFCSTSGMELLIAFVKLNSRRRQLHIHGRLPYLTNQSVCAKFAGWLRLQRFGGSEQPSSSHGPTPGWLLIRTRLNFIRIRQIFILRYQLPHSIPWL